MSFMFRVTFSVGRTTRIDSPAQELVLEEDGGTRVYLRSIVPDQPVDQAVELALRGEGYSSETVAAEEGARWVDALQLGMIAEFMAVDFDERRGPRGALGQASLDQINGVNPDVRLDSDRPGLVVAPEHPAPLFIRVRGEGIAGKNAEAIATKVKLAYRRNQRADDRSLLACEMYAASHAMPLEDPRFLMLMVAVEALIERGARGAAQLEAIDALVASLDEVGMPKDEETSFRQTLLSLRTESISRAGQRLARSLDGRQYGGLPPVSFFKRCYDYRSALVHGHVRRPAMEEIRALLSPLEHFVRDLVLLRNGLEHLAA